MSESIILRAVRGLENVVFGGRLLIVILFCLATLFFAAGAAGLLEPIGLHRAHIEGGLDKQVPSDHPYIATAKQFEGQTGSGNIVLIALEAKGGTIFTKGFFDELNHVADDMFFLPGVDRAHLAYMFSPNVRVVELAEDGFHASGVLPDDFTPTEEGFAKVRANLLKGSLVGRLVSDDFSTALIAVPLLEHDPRTGAALDYIDFAHKLETDIKVKYETQYPDVQIHITGFARAVGEIADGASWVGRFFLIALAITTFLLYRVSHHWWLTAAPLLCSLSAIIWQIGLVGLFGYGIDVYSVLIPFLIFSIGVSHGVQMILSTGQLAAAGEESYQAARLSFRRLFLPGSVALITGVITFLTITTIRIPVIRELAAIATIGIGALAFTNLIWLPLMVSYAKISPQTIARMQRALDRREKFWHLLAILVQPRYAVMLSLGAAVVGIGAFIASEGLIVGDLNQGVPELRPNSRFNLDTLFISKHFGNGVDSLIVFATGPADSCLDKANVQAIDDFVDFMRFVPGVHGTQALPGAMKFLNTAFNEGNLRWAVISHDRHVLGQNTGGSDANRALTNPECSVMPITLYLDNHKATTLSSVIQAVKDYKIAHPNLPLALELAGGNAGTAAAINESVEAAQIPMLTLVYVAMVIICFVTFRSPRAVICIIVPLALVSLIANGAMALLGIGLKVSTLPVTALGVGIGVDYGIYKFSRLSHYMGEGMSLHKAYIQTLRETGSAVIFTGLTLSIGVATWVFSPLQFQADMGLLLTLMFFMNMVGAIILLPALIGIMQIIKPQRAEDMARSSVLHHV
jgi:predicted RND superfamily exporter protein